MKILVVQDTDWIERGPHQQHHLFERLALKGHEIIVIDYEILWRLKEDRKVLVRTKEFKNVSKIYENANIRVIRPGVINLPVLSRISSIVTHRFEINRLIREFKPDVIVANSLLNGVIALNLARKHNISFIFHVIDTYHTIVPLKFAQVVAKFLEKKLFRQADHVVVINNKLKDFAIDFGAAPSRTAVVLTGVDLEKINPYINADGIRNMYGLRDDDIVLFFMGWLYDFSGVKEIAIELAEVVSDFPKIKLLVVGEGDCFKDLCEIRERYNLEKHLILTGKQPYSRIPKFIAISDICLLPFHLNEVTKDIVPIKIYEYMAGGKPVVANKLPGVMREIENGNGVIYADGVPQVLEETIELLRNVNLKTEGLKARKFVEKKHDWARITDEFETLLMKHCTSRDGYGV